MKEFFNFIRNWALPIAILLGAAAYVVYINIPALYPTGPYCYKAVSKIQPILIFLMLFFSFCQVPPTMIRPRKWHLYLAGIQACCFIFFALLQIFLPKGDWQVLLESAMLMLICPTATAAAVIVRKLDGDVAGLITYLILINIVTAVLVPIFVPLIHPNPEVTFMIAFQMILAQTFPVLICPALGAWLIRLFLPKLNDKFCQWKDLPFYLWLVALFLAILMTVRSIYHSSVPALYQVGIGVVSLLCCVFQFWMGRRTGRKFNETITAGCALGQKNTVFAIWMGYTFLTPVTAIAGGFYSLWHNIYDSYQLYEGRHNKLPHDVAYVPEHHHHHHRHDSGAGQAGENKTD